MNEGHIRLRRGLLDHIDTGKITGDMLAIYVYLLFKADYNTGIVWSISAPYIALKLKKPLKMVQRLMMKLEKSGYFKRFGQRGQIRHYKVLINRYLLFNGVLIRADYTTDINNLAWECGLNKVLSGTYKILKKNLIRIYLSSYKEVKNIRIKEKD